MERFGYVTAFYMFGFCFRRCSRGNSGVKTTWSEGCLSNWLKIQHFHSLRFYIFKKEAHSPPTSAWCPSFHPTHWAAFSHQQRGQTFLPLTQTEGSLVKHDAFKENSGSQKWMTLNHNNTPQRTWFLHWWVLGGWWARLLFNVTCTCVPQYGTFFLLTSQGAWSNCAALLVVFMFTLCNFYHTFKWPNIPSTDTSTHSSSATFPPPFLHIWQQRVGDMNVNV